MSFLDGLLVRLERAIQYVTIVLTVGIAVVMLAQVFFRYVLNSSLLWSEVLAVSFMIWIVFLGSAMMMRRWEHIAILTFAELLPAPLRAVAQTLTKLATVVFLVGIAYYGFSEILGPFSRKVSGLGISINWVRGAIPVGAVLMLIFVVPLFVVDTINLFRRDLRYFDRYGSFGIED